MRKHDLFRHQHSILLLILMQRLIMKFFLSLPRTQKQKLFYIHQINQWLRAHHIINFPSSILWKKIQKLPTIFDNFSSDEIIFFFFVISKWTELQRMQKYNELQSSSHLN